MIETLMEIHERQSMGVDPFGQEVKYIAGLFRRGLVDVKPWTTEKGKYYMGFFLTDAGKEYLEKLKKEHKHPIQA
jgi:hypothetical protein